MIKRKDWMRILCLTHYYNSQVDEEEECLFYDVPSFKTFNMNFVDYKFRCEKEYKAFFDKYSALPHFMQVMINDGKEEIFYPNGNKQIVESNGIITLEYQNGIKEIKYPNGKEFVVYPDGTKNEIVEN